MGSSATSALVGANSLQPQSGTLGSTFRAGPLATLQNGLYVVHHPLETPQKCVWTNVGHDLTFASSDSEYHQFQLQLG